MIGGFAYFIDTILQPVAAGHINLAFVCGGPFRKKALSSFAQNLKRAAGIRPILEIAAVLIRHRLPPCGSSWITFIIRILTCHLMRKDRPCPGKLGQSG
jgi:hypothetical protein